MSPTPETAETDESLVRAIVAGESDRFQELYARHVGKIRAYARRRVRCADDAEDITQDVFLEIYLCLHRFEGRSRFLTWAFGIAYNRVCRFHRSKRALGVSMDQELAESLPAPEAGLDRRAEASRLLGRCTEVLDREVPAQQREAFRERHFEARAYPAMARRMGRSERTLRMQAWRARQSLLQRTPGLRGFLQPGS